MLFVLILSSVVVIACDDNSSPAHTHTFSEEWTQSETYHWYNATCNHADLTKNLGEHVFEGVGNTCVTCDYVSAARGLEFTLSDSRDYYILTGAGTFTGEDLIIPDSHLGVPVKEIGVSVFQNDSRLKSVVIPDSVESIYTSAFRCCSALETITVSEGNEKYHSSGNCIIETESKTLVIGCPSSVIPTDGSVTSIGEYAFYDCVGLTHITIPENITDIGECAFANCSDLTEINYYAIDASFFVINESAINSYAPFSDLDKADVEVKLTIGANVKKIPDFLFVNAGIMSVEFEEGSVCESIGYAAFRSTAITNIVLPDSITSIGNGAFGEGEFLQYNVKDNCKYLGNVSNPYFILMGVTNKSLTTYNIDSATKIIYSAAFGVYGSPCYALTDIVIPDSVTSIGNGAFANCELLGSITIGAGVTYIGSRVFEYCTNLTSATFKNTDGWTRNHRYNDVCEDIDAADLADPATAASYLRDNSWYAWTRDV